MKRILALLIAIVLTTAFTVGSTVAYVTYTSDVPAKVTVTIDNAQERSEKVVLFTDGSYWEPGHMQVRHVQMVGENFSYRIKFTSDVAGQKLAEAMEVWYCPSSELTADMDRQEILSAMDYAGTLAEVMAANDGVFVSNDRVETGASVAVALRMKEDAGNIFMGLAITDLYMIVETQPVSSGNS